MKDDPKRIFEQILGDGGILFIDNEGDHPHRDQHAEDIDGDRAANQTFFKRHSFPSVCGRRQKKERSQAALRLTALFIMQFNLRG